MKFNVNNSGASAKDTTPQPDANSRVSQQQPQQPISQPAQPSQPNVPQQPVIPQAQKVPTGHDTQIVSELNLPKAPKVGSTGNTGAMQPISGNTRSLPKLDDIMGTGSQPVAPDIGGLTNSPNDTGAFQSPVQPVQPQPIQQLQEQAYTSVPAQTAGHAVTQQQNYVQPQSNIDPTIGMAAAQMQQAQTPNNNKQNNKGKNKSKGSKLTWIIIAVVGVLALAIVGAILFVGMGGDSEEVTEEPVQEEIERTNLGESEYPKKIKEIDEDMHKVITANTDSSAQQLTSDTAKKAASNYSAIKLAIDKALTELDKYNPPTKYEKSHEAYVQFLKDMRDLEQTNVNSATDFAEGKIKADEYTKQSGDALNKYITIMQTLSAELDRLGVKDAYTINAFNIEVSSSTTANK